MIISGTVDELERDGYFDNVMLRGYFRDDDDKDEDEYEDDDEYCDDDDE